MGGVAVTLQQFGIAYCLLLIALGIAGMAIERYIIKRRKWPRGHGDSYWTTPKRVDHD